MMELGLIGLGKMGGQMAQRLIGAGHTVVGFDANAATRLEVAKSGVTAAESLADLVKRLKPPRAVWVMVPHGPPTASTIAALLESLAANDILVDGGNSHFSDSQAAAKQCAARGVHFIDAGVSGGIWGLTEGYCLMVGGPSDACQRLEPIFKALAPASGWARVGASGAGHFVKMIHNAIEYAMLQSYGEGFECMRRSEFDLQLGAIADLWSHGAVVRSWLLELLTRALRAEGDDLAHVAPYIDDSGTGRWSVEYALANAIPIPVITQSLYERFASRIKERFSARVIAALRQQFGGHAVRTEK
jgi:6-phosphogluconate dehydrogenase